MGNRAESPRAPGGQRPAGNNPQQVGQQSPYQGLAPWLKQAAPTMPRPPGGMQLGIPQGGGMPTGIGTQNPAIPQQASPAELQRQMQMAQQLIQQQAAARNPPAQAPVPQQQPGVPPQWNLTETGMYEPVQQYYGSPG